MKKIARCTHRYQEEGTCRTVGPCGEAPGPVRRQREPEEGARPGVRA